MVINKNKNFCYRVCHIENLPHILENGLCTKYHPKASADFISIGNSEIIGVRDDTKVKIEGYGIIGEYVPFYFTPKSMMLYNIITGFREPIVKKRLKSELMVIRSVINDLSKIGKFFFTDGQANVTSMTNHFNDLKYLSAIDWDIIQKSDFSKNETDNDKQRRYQAEFLVYKHVPVSSIESINVYNDKAETIVKKEMAKTNILLPIHITKEYFFG